MIDLHNHILPGVDDGAVDLDESIAIARQFVSEGVIRVAATPHRDPERNSGVEGPAMRHKLAELQAALDQAGVPLEVLPGHELYLTPDAPALLVDGRVSALGGGSAVLVEVSLLSEQAPLYLDETLFRLQVAGYQPVLAHPERYPFVQRDVSSLEELVTRDVIMQLTSPSLLGEYGGRIRRTAEHLLRHGWYAVAASDRHHAGGNRSLADLHQRIVQVTGADTADLLLRTNPERLLSGESVLMPVPPPPEQPGRLERLFRR